MEQATSPASLATWWREQRQVSHQLVVNYSRMKLTLKPEGIAVRLRGKMVDIYDFPNGRLEFRWKGRWLPYSAFDKLQRVSHAAIVENRVWSLRRSPHSPADQSVKPS
jgi:hypothetical protein